MKFCGYRPPPGRWTECAARPNICVLPALSCPLMPTRKYTPMGAGSFKHYQEPRQTRPIDALGVSLPYLLVRLTSSPGLTPPLWDLNAPSMNAATGTPVVGSATDEHH